MLSFRLGEQCPHGMLSAAGGTQGGPTCPKISHISLTSVIGIYAAEGED